MVENERGDTSVLATLFAHNSWANLKLLNFCEGLSDEHLGTMAVGGFGSIRDTLRHLVSAEVSYVSRVNGRLPEKPLSKEEFPTFEVMKDAARWASPELLAISLATREDSSVRASSEKQIEVYPIRSIMVQAINHSTEHRTQIATIITQLGMEPPDMSGWAYMEETGEIQITLAEDAG